jgi:Mg2+ and Co2+ transporter CorA
MNVLFPGEGTAEAFWPLLAAMAVITAGLVIWFRRRGWL